MANTLRAITLLVAGTAALGCFVWAVFSALPSIEKPTPVPITYVPITFADLDAWPADDHLAAIGALTRSCDLIDGRPDTYAFSNLTFPSTDILISGRAADWQPICSAARAVLDQDEPEARQFFETWFKPFEVLAPSQDGNRFTAYYEPVIGGSREKTEAFNVPLLARPGDLVQVDLGTFRPHLRGERIAGRVKNGHLKPYESRAQIEAGALKDVETVVYLANAVDAFFTQIQGSARVELPDGTSMRINYAGQNGHPYTAIGAPLIRRGEIPREEMSMQAIRDWLETHPDKSQSLMNENASFIFFREIEIEDESLGPVGAQGVSLTSDRSLAVDRKFHPLGLPFWVETTEPLPKSLAAPEESAEEGAEETGPPLNLLMIAQDTGGAIQGPVRGDLFFGTGAEAAERAGPMNQKGRLVIFVPSPVANAFMASLTEKLN